KKSVTLDLRAPAGARIFKGLVREADVMVESFDPGVLACMGLSYDALSENSPGLVMASITQFGQDGPYRDYKANELIQYALSGLMYPTGLPEREPVQSGGYLPQYKAGLVGAIGVLAALQWRDINDLGQHLDISIHEVAANFLEITPPLYSYQGRVRGRTGSTLSPPTPLCDLYDCKEGHIIVTVLTQQQWASMCEMMGHPEIIDDARFINPRTMTDEAKNYLWEMMGSWFRERAVDEAFELCQLLRVPSAKVMNARDLLDDPHLAERGFFQSLNHPYTGPLNYPGPGFMLSDASDGSAPAPLLGQHNREVYRQRLGYSSHELARLGAVGVI
ncbi:MAG: CaiB/BaiF CoA transferase family protein, partial [Dehalococcoidia bacterium]